MRSDTARRAAADMVRVLVRAWRTAVRTCRRFAGSFNSGKARSIATISARSCLSVTSAPSRANSKPLRTEFYRLSHSHSCRRGAPLYQTPLHTSTSEQQHSAMPAGRQHPPFADHSVRAASHATPRLVAIRWHSSNSSASDGQRVRLSLGWFAEPSLSDQQRTGTDAFRSRQAQHSLSRPRHGSAASARRAALASSDWTRS
jgi:hypothetical protein